MCLLQPFSPHSSQPGNQLEKLQNGQLRKANEAIPSHPPFAPSISPPGPDLCSRAHTSRAWRVEKHGKVPEEATSVQFSHEGLGFDVDLLPLCGHNQQWGILGTRPSKPGCRVGVCLTHNLVEIIFQKHPSCLNLEACTVWKVERSSTETRLHTRSPYSGSSQQV